MKYVSNLNPSRTCFQLTKLWLYFVQSWSVWIWGYEGQWGETYEQGKGEREGEKEDSDLVLISNSFVDPFIMILSPSSSPGVLTVILIKFQCCRELPVICPVGTTLLCIHLLFICKLSINYLIFTDNRAVLNDEIWFEFIDLFIFSFIYYQGWLCWLWPSNFCCSPGACECKAKEERNFFLK